MKPSTEIRAHAVMIRGMAEKVRVAAAVARSNLKASEVEAGANEALHEVQLIAEAIGSLAAVLALRRNWGAKI